MSGIIVGVDGSDHSRYALAWAMREAVLLHAPLTVITVHPASVSYWGAVTYPEGRFEREEARQAVQDLVDKVASDLGQPLPEITVRVESGVAAEELVNASRDADLLVVGSRGTGGFARLLMGSVSSQTAHHAACPVVVIPGTRGYEPS
jgi:nucleotide-binding universal stress UspA family protein